MVFEFYKFNKNLVFNNQQILRVTTDTKAKHFNLFAPRGGGAHPDKQRITSFIISSKSKT